MFLLIGTHEIADFEAWKRGSDATSETSFYDEWGVLDETVYRTVEGDRLIVINKFNTREEAEKFKALLESPQTQQKLMQNGAKMPLTVWIAEEV